LHCEYVGYAEMRRAFLALSLLVSATAARPAAADVAYRTEIVGISDKSLARDLRNASQLVQQEKRKPETALALQRRAEADRERLEAALRANGYYDGTIAFAIDDSVDPVKVRVNVDPGARYTLANVNITGPDGPPPLLARYAPLAFGLKPGGPALSKPVLDAEPRIVRTLTEHGFPLAKIADRRVEVDKAAKTMDVTYTVDPGPLAAFGPLTVSGTKDVNPDYVRNRAAWNEGNPYDIRFVDRTRKDLVASGLFATVRVRPAESVDSDGRIPMSIEVTERPPRSVAVGLNYDTSLGASARAYWEHRNVFGNAERLRTTLETGEKRQALQGDFRKPDVLAPNRDFVATALAENERLEAYDRRRILFFSGLEQRFSDIWTGGAGAQVERTHIEESAGPFDYTLFGLPLFLRRDVTDNLLDPTEGSRQSIATTPYVGSSLNFLSSRLQASAYRALDDKREYVLAGFAAVGSIIGEPRDALPKDKRLYAGGGGSVRGYGYQKAGPLDSAGNPIGGRSSLELGMELRVKVTETIGIVPFLEAGNVYESTLPKPGGGLRYGTGLGLRYYTPIGPVRFDVAVPLNKRPQDDSFQIYVSIGQAF
jgi:translocation and assembly module TamA